MKNVLAVVAIFAFAFVCACLMALNVKTGYTTLIRIESQEQYEYIISGDEPTIAFVSLRDTPYADEVKILKVNYHTTAECLFDSTRVVDDWLGNVGIRSYPELVR